MVEFANSKLPGSFCFAETAREDGVPSRCLRSPERFDSDGTLTLRVMELGDKDDSGRRRPVPTEEVETLNVNTLIYAIGDDPDENLFK